VHPREQITISFFKKKESRQQSLQVDISDRQEPVLHKISRRMMQLSGRGILMYSVFLLMQEEMPGLDSLLEYNEIVRKIFGSKTEGYLF
jgi:hypothetical protein